MFTRHVARRHSQYRLNCPLTQARAIVVMGRSRDLGNAAEFVVKSEQRVTEATRHTDETAILAITRYPNRVAVAQNALIIQEARHRNKVAVLIVAEHI